MATVNNKTPKEKTRQEWILDRKRIAKQQLSQIPDLARNLFNEKDLTRYLLLISRMPYYGFQNLLLIYNKYPEASVLAGFPVWQRLMGSADSSQKVLKAEAIGKGIDLIVPFTNVIGEDKFELTWYSVLVFDIRQTNVRSFNLSSSVYSQDALHEQFLLDAITAVLGSCYGRRVVYAPPTSSLLFSGAKGTITDKTVSILRGLKDDDALLWLTEALCELELSSSELSLSAKRVLQHCVKFCLYSMWLLDNPGILPGCHNTVPAGEQAAFLDILQKAVFSLHQKVAGAYLSLRQERQFHEEELVSNENFN